MAIWSWLQEVALLIVVYEITASKGDLLETFRPKEDNPPELNEFLSSVLEHKDDFGAVQQAARKYENMRMDIQDVDLSFLDTNFNRYKFDDKRHIQHFTPHRKFRNLGLLPPNMRGKFGRIRRGTLEEADMEALSEDYEDSNVKKRFPAIIMLQSDDVVQKRMPSPIAMKSDEAHGEKHLPTHVFSDPDVEQLEKKKRTAERIVVEPEGEKGEVVVNEEKKASKQKKQAMDFEQEVHRTYKSNAGKGMRSNMKVNKEGDVYYVDLEDAAARERERYNDRRAYDVDPRRRGFYGPSGHRMYNRPFGGRPGQMDYPQYEGPVHHNLNDEVAFEKALSYEIDPTYHEQISYNNPSGNNLYSVDDGRPENIQLYPQGFNGQMGRYDYPPQDPIAVTHERFFIDADNQMRKLQPVNTDSTSSSTSSTTSTIGDKSNSKTIEHVGNGFIEITKTRRDSEDDVPLSKKSVLETEDTFERDNDGTSKNTFEKNKERSSILSKHSLHPLRIKDTSRDEIDDTLVNDEVEDEDDSSHSINRRNANEEEKHMQARKLQFIDYEAPNQEENYEDVPNRPRRDFLDALGMKNEEDYSEDNPYRDVMNTNNTDVHNDTHIPTERAKNPTPSKATTSHQKEDITKIKQILEERKEATTVAPKAKCNKSPQNRPKKSFREDEYFDGMNGDDEVRRSRDANKEIENKIMANKQKIYNPLGENHNKNTNHVQVRQDKPVSRWIGERTKMRKYVDAPHRINKKEDNEIPEITELTEMTMATDMTMELFETTTSLPGYTTESDKAINTAYEQIAHQMDIENEKLAQVVNGRLASKIVSKVFNELKKKSTLKTKFYSGLSRKHVNFAGTIDFDIFKTNETEDVDEARLLLTQITKVLNKLVINQVRRKLCQRLPDELKEYLEVMLNVKNTLETANFVPNQQQGDFLFTYHDDKNAPPFDVHKLQDILVNLESLLLRYNNMNEECQNRAEPVKDYIEKHVTMLKQIVNCPSHHCGEDKFSETKRESPMLHQHLLEKQLESVGLGRNQEFIPNFDLSQLVRNKMKPISWKTNKKRDTQKSNDYKSAQFKKLQMAAQKVREKRENEKKIAELFGAKKKRATGKEVEYEQPVVYSLG